MNREIKFRAWDGSQMLQNFSLTIHHFFGFFQGQRIDEFIQPLEGIESGEPIFSNNCLTKDNEEYELMQYTGLKDKNGVEIYEGDILENKYEDKAEATGFGIDRAETRFMGGCFGWVGSLTGKHHPFDETDKGYWEVIGNICQHPELLTLNDLTPCLER
jgi:uncharacterized phage protein (TIGR01671 family)